MLIAVGTWKKAYRASGGRAALIIVGATAILAVGVLACSAHAVALDFDGELELRRRGRRVLEDREPSCTATVANAKVERRVVAPVITGRSPLACILDGNAGWVDIVLGGRVSALPVVVVVGVRAGEVAGGARLSVKRNGLGFRAWVVRTADGHVLGQIVLNENGDLGRARHAKIVRHARVGEMELATLALKAANRLASSALSGWPLRLLVASGAGVGAEIAFVAALPIRTLALRDGHNIGEATTIGAWGLDTNPSTKLNPVNCYRTVIRRES